MSHDATDEARPVTSVELLNAAVWREIGWEEPQTPAAFVVGVVSGRLRINGTQSAPEGIYWAIGKEPSKETSCLPCRRRSRCSRALLAC